MIPLFTILFALLLTKAGLSMFDYIYQMPPKQTAKMLRIATSKKQSLKQTLLNEVIDPMQSALLPFIKIPEEKRISLELNLARAGINQMPEEYYARALVFTLLVVPIPFLVMLVGVKALFPITLLLVPAIFMQHMNSYTKALKIKKNQIEIGLPNFVRAILYKLNDSKEEVVKADLISIFEDYLKVANPIFAYDISVLIMEMKSKDVEAALRNFNNRLAIPEVGFLCNALVGVTRGEHQNETLAALAREMDIKGKENIRRELNKRPKKVIMACIPLAIITVAGIVYVFTVALMSGFATLA